MQEEGIENAVVYLFVELSNCKFSLRVHLITVLRP